MNTLTPRETVSELDKYIVGQNAAKRMVAIARKAMRIAAGICVYTNENVTIETLDRR